MILYISINIINIKTFITRLNKTFMQYKKKLILSFILQVLSCNRTKQDVAK